MDAARAVCRWLMFLPLALILAVILCNVGRIGTPPDTWFWGSLPGMIGFAAGIVLAWIIASLPTYKHRRRMRKASRAKLFVYPLHWTLREIDEYERGHPTFAAAIRRATDFPALPSA